MEAFHATTFWVSCSFLALWAEVSVLGKQKEGVCMAAEGEGLEEGGKGRNGGSCLAQGLRVWISACVAGAIK